MAAEDVTAREGRLTFARIVELQLAPVSGRFNVAHLREIHRRIFQDLPHHAPGDFRPDAPGHMKTRALEATRFRYPVAYALRSDVDARLGAVLQGLTGGDALRGLSVADFSDRMARLYGDLDHLHPFREGNSRTLRTFTAQLAEASGHALDWGTTNANAVTRDNLYMARDFAVIQRTYPGIAAKDPADFTDRTEYSAYLTLGELQKADRLSEIIRQSADRALGTRTEALEFGAIGVELHRLLPVAQHQARYDEERARVAAARSTAMQPLHEVSLKRLAWIERDAGARTVLASAEAIGVSSATIVFTGGERAIERVLAIGQGLATAEREHRRGLTQRTRGSRHPLDRER